MSTPLIRILNSSFHRTSKSPPLFPNLTFTLPSLHPASTPQKWAILGPSNSGKSTFLQILQGKHICDPPAGRTFPAITEKRKYPGSAIALVDFSSRGMSGEEVVGEYMSSRYESRRDAKDLTLRQWLERTALNLPLYTDNFDFEAHTTPQILGKHANIPLETVTHGLRLTKLLEQPVSTLSNGQGRRARIAQALLRGVEVVLVDEPFMGLDPWSTEQLSTLLNKISTPVVEDDGSNQLSSQVVMSLRPQDHLPEWITHIAYAENSRIAAMGEKEKVLSSMRVDKKQHAGVGLLQRVYDKTQKDIDHENLDENKGKVEKQEREALVEMKGVKISYRNREILKDFSWTIKRGDRWGLFGPNGSGKTTILAIITSDHPLSYSQPVKLFNRPRLPEPGQAGISVFEIQSRIGHSSPEIHQFFPRRLTLRQCVESAWSDTFITKPNFTANAKERVDGIFEYFGIGEEEQKREFGSFGVSTQRLALFMRAVVKRPDVVILDEAFSGMDGKLRDRCMAYLENGLEERQALVVVSHLDEEIPEVVDRWVRLKEVGEEGKVIFGKR
ncbi:hypothetical protein TWF694_003024 [Orbilia ellipsospora]|uniref:ABC transporter domain-containing protein n=1 Tax=Orbilia ellipsospora TaxID=2528407 RepID=A0AAV9X2Q9_9PEZI